MKQIALLLFCLLKLSSFILGQTEEKKASEIKELSKKIEYLNNTWKAVSSIEDAVYLRYNYYTDDKNKPNVIYYKDKKSLKTDSTEAIKTNEGIIILNGEYKWYDKRGGCSHMIIIKMEKEFGRSHIVGA